MSRYPGIQDFLIPKDPTAARAAVDALGRPAGAGLQVSTRVKADIESHAGALMEQHADMLPPNCERAHLHLQMAALALSAQRSLLKEAANGEYESGAESTLAARSVVAGARILKPSRPCFVTYLAIPNWQEHWGSSHRLAAAPPMVRRSCGFPIGQRCC